jgi:hypothetical protein
MKNTILHKAETRGGANHGWMITHHTFSFANYYDPERIHFGALRVLNDDYIAPGMGFGMHPHDNMEIITIPMEGEVEHKDSMGNSGIIKFGEVQVMSAGTGIMHSEYNPCKENPLKLLQIWVLPNKKSVTPRYEQLTLNLEDRKNKFQQILSPNADDAGVWIHQNAWFHLTEMDKGKVLEYELKDKTNGVYIFVIKGLANIDKIKLNERDGLGVWNTEKLSIFAESDTEVLIMEVPM